MIVQGSLFYGILRDSKEILWKFIGLLFILCGILRDFKSETYNAL